MYLNRVGDVTNMLKVCELNIAIKYDNDTNIIESDSPRKKLGLPNF